MRIRTIVIITATIVLVMGTQKSAINKANGATESISGYGLGELVCGASV
jgi:hypothetical protein